MRGKLLQLRIGLDTRYGSVEGGIMIGKSDLQIKLLAMDVDGVLTDGGIYMHDDGTESKKFHVHDGAWIRIWKRLGLLTALISGRQCKAVDHRAKDLGIDFVYQGAHQKVPFLEQLLAESGVHAQEVAYIGDEIGDLPVIRRVGFGVAVADALAEVRDAADYVTSRRGGEGAVQELICYLLKRMEMWNAAVSRYEV